MDKIRSKKQDLLECFRAVPVVVLFFLVFACSVGVFFCIFGLLFGWVTINGISEILLHCVKLCCMAVVGIVCWIVLGKYRKWYQAVSSNTAPNRSASEEKPAMSPCHPVPSPIAQIVEITAQPEEQEQNVCPVIQETPTVVQTKSAPASQPKKAASKPQKPVQNKPQIDFKYDFMTYFLVQENQKYHLMHHPADRFDWSPQIDEWLPGDYFKTHSVEEFCVKVENLCKFKDVALDRGLITRKLLDAGFITGTFVPPAGGIHSVSTKHRNRQTSRTGFQTSAEEDACYFHRLGDATLLEEKHSYESEYYAVDTRSGKPCYIHEHCDGGFAMHIWYDTVRPVSWEEVIQNTGRNDLKGINDSNWKDYLFTVVRTADSVSFSWPAINSPGNAFTYSILCENGYFHFHQPYRRPETVLTLEQLNNFDAFRALLWDQYPYLLDTLWDFLQERRKYLTRSSGRGNGNITWQLEGGMLTVSGTGQLDALYNSTDLQRQTMHDPHNLGPWFGQHGFSELEAKRVRTMAVEYGITGISFLALHGMDQLQSLFLPSSAERIDLKPDSTFTIHGFNGSPAIHFARENHVAFHLRTDKERKEAVRPPCCASSQHHFGELIHTTHGAYTLCKKCGLKAAFNRAAGDSPTRIVQREMEEFLDTYRGSTIDFQF